MSSFIAGILVVVFCIATIQAVKITPCDKGDIPLSVHIDGCPDSNCRLVVGTNSSLIADFKRPATNPTSLQAILQLEDENQNTFTYNLGECIDKASANPRCRQIYTGKIRFQFDSPITPPTGDFVNTIILNDEKNVTLFCFKFNVDVVPA